MMSVEHKKKAIIIPKDVKGLIFDCDGTLVDSMPLHMEGWRAAFQKFNADYKESFLMSACGMKEADVITFYNQVHGTAINSALMVEYKHEFINRHLSTIKEVEPIAAIAKKYHGVLPMAVVSGSTSNIVYAELEIIGLQALFPVILTADDPIPPKPAPDLFYEAARRMNLTPSDCLVFEDGEAGLEAARKAGMRTIDVRKYLGPKIL